MAKRGAAPQASPGTPRPPGPVGAQRLLDTDIPRAHLHIHRARRILNQGDVAASGAGHEGAAHVLGGYVSAAGPGSHRTSDRTQLDVSGAAVSLDSGQRILNQHIA